MSEYIEREALVKYFQERFDWLRKESEKPVGGGKVIIDTELQTGAIIAKEFLDKAKAAKTADVAEVRHGEWLSAYEYALKIRATDKDMLDFAKADKVWKFCPYCEQQVKYLFNYCPNCGAKMDGKGEG